jgi:hypothetical protein
MRRGVLAGLVLAFLAGGTATAGGRLPLVAGDYTYHLNEGTSNVQLLAFATAEGVAGTFSFHGSYVDLSGTVTCVSVRGVDAWVAGVIANAEDVGVDGWMVRVKDHGVRDQAVTFMDDYALAIAWCEGASTEYDREYLQPVVAGWLIVR